MLKTITRYSCCFLLLLAACSEKKETVSSWSEDKLHGSVKSTIETAYMSMEKDSVHMITASFYDENGNLIENYSIDKWSDTTDRHLNVYNDKNQLLRSKYINRNGEEVYTSHFTYDKRGNQIKELRDYPNFDIDIVLYSSYNKHNELIKRKHSDTRGNYLTNTYYLNFKNRTISHAYDSNHVHITTCVLFKNDLGQILNELSYNLKTNRLFSKIQEYNTAGDLIKQNMATNSMTDVKYSYEYKYDAKGNWIEKTIFLHGAFYFVVDRKILYY